jgi:hypothetical protein
MAAQQDRWIATSATGKESEMKLQTAIVAMLLSS